ncbi:MAG: glycoside hydrolase [Dysgonamonadaceae bacterium]|jgi:hypothetical protein|nr:glycoside hydrolase [Dysgonamonadaceae bacterium]
MNLRTGFYIFCSVIMIFVMVSCLDGDETETIIPIDAQISSFYVSHDSITALDSVVFSIDHFKGLIYNHDSLRYGVAVNEKVIAGFATSAYAVVDITHAEDGDSTIISSGDSLDLRTPAKLRVYAYSGVTKTYEVRLNIHQVDPDSIRYWQIANDESILNADEVKVVYFSQKFYAFTKNNGSPEPVKVFSSTDAVNWLQEASSGLSADINVNEIRNSGQGLYAVTTDGRLYRSVDATTWQAVTTPYPVEAFFGYMAQSPTQEAGYALLVVKEGQNIPTFTADFSTWSYGTEVSPDFPVNDYSSVNYNKMMLDRITVIGGKNAAGSSQNAVWSTSNGTYWAKLTDKKIGLFPVMEGYNAFNYNGVIYLLNGRMEDGSYNRVTYISKDGGTTWQPAERKTYLPDDYTERYGASLVVDKDHYQYIIGGRRDEPLKEVWKGILNKLSF